MRGFSKGATLGLWASSIVLSGVAGAGAATLITGAQIKNGSVASVDLRDNSIESRDIRNGTIRAGDLHPTAIPPAAAPATAVVYRDGPVTPLLVSFGRIATLTASCPEGTQAIGGGFTSTAFVTIQRSQPTGLKTGWSVTVRDDTTPNGFQNVLQANVVCLSS